MSDTARTVTDLLKKMVSFDTVNTNLSGKPRPEAELVAYLEARAEEQSFETRRIAVPGQSDELLILYRVQDGAPWILFDSHVDTVSVEGMSIEPFAAHERDGKIWGRGACDTKGSGAAMLTALEEYRKGGSSNANIALLFSVDEESGMSGICAFTREQYPALGFDFAGAVVGEPTGLRPVVAHNGVIRFIVRTAGTAAHSSDPAQGKSAISGMARLVLFLEAEFIPSIRASHPLTGRAQCSINVIRGGTSVNIIPAACKIEVDRRLVPGEAAQEAAAAFAAAINVFTERNPDADVSFEVLRETPALANDYDEWAAAVGTGIAGEGIEGPPEGVKYTTHAGYAAESGIPAVVLGPGNIAQGHTKDEWIDAEELVRGVSVYRAIMERCRPR